MDINTKANSLVSNLGKLIKVDGLSFDQEGNCIILLDDKILFILELAEDLNGIIFSVILGNLPVEGRESMLYELLSANFYWNRTDGATIGIDDQTDIVTLCYFLTFPLKDDSDFEITFERLANISEYWIDKLLVNPGKGVK
jgi:hypothetical protein